MYRLAVVGDYESVCAFEAVGFDTYSVGSAGEAAKVCGELSEGEYAVIFVSEGLMGEEEELFYKYRDMKLPAIIPIPSANGGSGFALSRLKKYVEQAVGSDIIFDA